MLIPPSFSVARDLYVGIRSQKTKQKKGSDHACGYRPSSRFAAAAEVLTLYFGPGERELMTLGTDRRRDGRTRERVRQIEIAIASACRGGRNIWPRAGVYMGRVRVGVLVVYSARR